MTYGIILKNDDCYDIIHSAIKQKGKLKVKDIPRLKFALKQLRKIKYYKIKRLTDQIIQDILFPMDKCIFEMDDTLAVASELRLDESQVVFIGNKMSYNKIYQYYKMLLSSTDVDKRLSLAIRLLKNSELVRKNLYPILRNITNSKNINSQFIKSVKIMYIVLRDCKDIFDSQYLEALMMKTVEIVLNLQNNLVRSDIIVLIRLIRLLTYYEMSRKFLRGLLIKTIQQIRMFRFINQDDDLIRFMAHLRLLLVLYQAVIKENASKEVESFNSAIESVIQGLVIEKPTLIDETEYKKIMSHVCLSKYKLLRNTKKLGSFELSKMLANDIKDCYNYNRVLHVLRSVDINLLDFLQNLIPSKNHEEIPRNNKIVNYFYANHQDTGRNTQLFEKHELQKPHDSGSMDPMEIEINMNKNTEYIILKHPLFDIDEVNTFYLFKFVSSKKFETQLSIKASKLSLLYLFEELFYKKSPQLILLLAYKTIKKKRLYLSQFFVNFLGFLLACHIEHRDCQITRKKEHKILHSIRTRANHDLKMRFISHFFLSLQRMQKYETCLAVPSLLLLFENVPLDHTVFNYFLKKFKKNKSVKDNMILLVMVCFFLIRKGSEIQTEIQSFEKSLINLIVCTKRTASPYFRANVEQDLLEYVFVCTQNERTELQKYYEGYKKGRPHSSEIFSLLKLFQEELEQLEKP